MYLKNKIKTLRYILEAIIVKLGLWIFYALGEKHAPNIAAKISQFIGKKIPVNKLAYQNLSNAMPELSEKEKEKILDDMWDNLGRIVGEFPHIAHCEANEIGRYIEVSKESQQNIEALKNNKKGGIILGAHIGNWEIGLKVFLKHGIKASAVYRPLNNPYVEKMVSSTRKTDFIPKSASGNRRIVEIIKNGGFVAILADQKVSEGEPVKFFHDDAITTTSIARIALKYKVPIIPARSIRIDKNFKFHAEIEKPLDFQPGSDINSDTLRLTREINCKLEEWIKQYPSQWFWVHNRWKR